MGAFLDSAKDIRKDKKSPPRQAYKTEAKLEKDKDKGIKMTALPNTPESTGTQDTRLVYAGNFVAEIKEVSRTGRTVVIEIESVRVAGVPDTLENRLREVPPQIKDEIHRQYTTDGFQAHLKYQRRTL